MMHPATELRFVNERIGYGVFAKEGIPRGTITWTADALDRSFTRAEIEAMEKPYQEILDKYTFRTRDARHVLCWDNARFVNHSCEANCLAPGFDFEIAVRDIIAGEELTDDYGSLNVEDAFECHCGSPRCRKTIHGDDLLVHTAEWDALVWAAFPKVALVAQPLWGFVREKSQVEQLLRDALRPPSCRENHCRARG